jgi:hypothetical protein
MALLRRSVMARRLKDTEADISLRRATGGKFASIRCNHGWPSPTHNPPKEPTNMDSFKLERLQTENNDPPAYGQIQVRAYELYLARGGAPGHQEEDWLRAEGELLAAAAPVAHARDDRHPANGNGSRTGRSTAGPTSTRRY